MRSFDEDALHKWARLRGYLVTSQQTANGVRYDLWGPHEATLVLKQVERADVEDFLACV